LRFLVDSTEKQMIKITPKMSDINKVMLIAFMAVFSFRKVSGGHESLTTFNPRYDKLIELDTVSFGIVSSMV